MSSNTCLKSCLYFFFWKWTRIEDVCISYWKREIFQQSLCWFTRGSSTSFLDDGFKYSLCSTLFKGKMNPFWRAYFSDGLVQPPTSYTSKDGLKPPTSFKWVLENGPFVGLPEDHQLLFGWPQKNPRRCYAPAMYAVSLHNLVGSKCRSEFFGRGSNRPQMPRYTCRDFDPWKTPVTVPINKAIFWGL